MDNRYYKYSCPPLMNDGRFITSYMRSSVFDQYVRNINNIVSAQDYKNFLQSNGDQIINNLKAHLKENNTCKIQGKCLPMNGPTSDDMISYLNNNTQNNYFDQVTNDFTQQNDISLTNLFGTNTQTVNVGENLDAQKAEEMNKALYAHMVQQQQQKNISDMNVIRPSNV